MDLFDQWEIGSAGPDAAVSFGDLAAPAALARWQMDLPSAPGLAVQQLAGGEARLQQRSVDLDQVPGHLERLLSARPAAAGGTVDFATGGPALSEAEQELCRWLEEARGPGAGTSFGLEPGRQTPARLAAPWAAGLERAQHLLAYAAWVETTIGGQPLGRTVATWSGDLRTVWGTETTGVERQWHSRSLRLALASRALILRAVFLTTQSAVKLAALLAVPGGAVLALPAAWTYVNKMLAEIGEYRRLATS